MIQIQGTIIGTIKDVGDGFYLAKFHDEQSKKPMACKRIRI